MSTTLTIRDETTGGKTTNEFTLEVLSERITVGELIRSRVYQEVKDYNLLSTSVYRGLVQPLEAENTPGGVRARQDRPGQKGPRQKPPIDWQEQLDVALEAFRRRQVLVLVGDRQVDDLEEELEITPQTVVTFVRLVPLVGG